MKFLAFFLILSLLSSGYCAAAHAFGEIPMKAMNSSPMQGMPDCSGMHSDMGDKTDGKSSPMKSGGMDCKLCCASLTGFPPPLMTGHAIESRVQFLFFHDFAHSDPRYRIFHPPRSPA
jgi:hypothetical protein